jgi:30S ribosomal protein S31
VAVAAAVATAAAAHRSAGKKPRLQGPLVSACTASASGPFHWLSESELFVMGKGDHRTRRGKIYQGSFGKSRPKDPAKRKKKAAAAAKR